MRASREEATRAGIASSPEEPWPSRPLYLKRRGPLRARDSAFPRLDRANVHARCAPSLRCGTAIATPTVSRRKVTLRPQRSNADETCHDQRHPQPAAARRRSGRAGHRPNRQRHDQTHHRSSNPARGEATLSGTATRLEERVEVAVIAGQPGRRPSACTSPVVALVFRRRLARALHASSSRQDRSALRWGSG